MIGSFRCDVKEIPEESSRAINLYEVKRSKEEKMLGYISYDDEGIDEICYKVTNEKYYFEFGLRFEIKNKKVSKIYAYYFPGD